MMSDRAYSLLFKQVRECTKRRARRGLKLLSSLNPSFFSSRMEPIREVMLSALQDKNAALALIAIRYFNGRSINERVMIALMNLYEEAPSRYNSFPHCPSLAIRAEIISILAKGHWKLAPFHSLEILFQARHDPQIATPQLGKSRIVANGCLRMAQH